MKIYFKHFCFFTCNRCSLLSLQIHFFGSMQTAPFVPFFVLCVCVCKCVCLYVSVQTVLKRAVFFFVSAHQNKTKQMTHQKRNSNGRDKATLDVTNKKTLSKPLSKQSTKHACTKHTYTYTQITNGNTQYKTQWPMQLFSCVKYCVAIK